MPESKATDMKSKGLASAYGDYRITIRTLPRELSEECTASPLIMLLFSSFVKYSNQVAMKEQQSVCVFSAPLHSQNKDGPDSFPSLGSIDDTLFSCSLFSVPSVR
jgi:hypothetical protein